MIVTGTENGKPKSKIFTVSVAKNQEFQNFDIEIPEEVYDSLEQEMSKIAK